MLGVIHLSCLQSHRQRHTHQDHGGCRRQCVGRNPSPQGSSVLKIRGLKALYLNTEININTGYVFINAVTSHTTHNSCLMTRPS